LPSTIGLSRVTSRFFTSAAGLSAAELTTASATKKTFAGRVLCKRNGAKKLRRKDFEILCVFAFPFSHSQQVFFLFERRNAPWSYSKAKRNTPFPPVSFAIIQQFV